MEETSGWTTRRRLLGGVIGAGTVALAGCLSGDDDSSDDEEPSDAESPRSGIRSRAELVAVSDHPIDEPAPFEDDHACPVCGMPPASYRIWNGQIAHADGTGLFFDTPGCLLAYLVLPDEHATDEAVETIWFTDFETQDIFEVDDGYLVEETDMGRHSFPMGGSPIPFEARDDAEAYVEEHDLHDDAVRTIDDVDRDFAEFYRGNRMPDE